VQLPSATIQMTTLEDMLLPSDERALLSSLRPAPTRGRIAWRPAAPRLVPSTRHSLEDLLLPAAGRLDEVEAGSTTRSAAPRRRAA